MTYVDLALCGVCGEKKKSRETSRLYLLLMYNRILLHRFNLAQHRIEKELLDAVVKIEVAVHRAPTFGYGEIESTAVEKIC